LLARRFVVDRVRLPLPFVVGLEVVHAALELLSAGHLRALDDRFARAAPRPDDLVEDRLRPLALDDEVGDAIGLTLVLVAGAPEVALELNARALLDRVRGLVRGGVEVGLVRERDLVAARVGLRAERVARLGRRASDERLHARDVVAAEARLDLV